jgi:hypothetical protein
MYSNGFYSLSKEISKGNKNYYLGATSLHNCLSADAALTQREHQALSFEAIKTLTYKTMT